MRRRFAKPCRVALCFAALYGVTATAQFDASAGGGALGFAHGPRTASLAAAPLKGVCGGPRLADAVARGADTIRTYAAPTVAELDRLHALGMRVIVGHWMPHEGTNVGKEGWPWEHAYEAAAEKMDREFAAVVDRIGAHPAIVMWSLGNEVRLEPGYLRQADRLSRILHDRHPDVPTSLTLVNAPAESIAAVRQHAPDIDVLGVNSYGQGAVGNAIATLQEHWGRPFYFSEFGPNGPWWGPQASWGPRFEAGASAKNADLGKAWERITAAEGCLGGCAFMWGRWPRERISYFSMLLPIDPWSPAAAEGDFRFTPLADEIGRCWTGTFASHRAPLLERIEIAGQTQCDVVVSPTAALAVTATATDPDSDAALRFRWWIAREDGESFRPVVGPVDSAGPAATITAPDERGAAFVLFCLAIDADEGCCGTTLPFKTAD